MHLLLFIALFTSSAFARYLPLSNIADVRGAVDSGDVTSVDDLWTRLAPEMHLAPVPVFAGAASAPSSPRFPRLLLATDDARLFAAATTQANHPAYGQLEFAAADPVTDELSLYLVDYRRNPVIERNPRECMHCHTVDGVVRLRVEGYPHWPGWFGNAGHHDTMFASELFDREFAAVKTFLSRPSPPRLLRGFRDGFQMTDDVHMTATRFTALAVLAEARAAARALAAGPDFARLRLALATNEFPRPFSAALDPELRAEYVAESVELSRRLVRDQTAYERYLHAEFGIRGERGTRTFNGQPYTFAHPFEFALNRAGSSVARFSTSGSTGAVNVNSGVGGWLSRYVGQIVADDLARELGVPEPADPDYVSTDGLRMPTVRELDHRFVDTLKARACERGLGPPGP